MGGGEGRGGGGGSGGGVGGWQQQKSNQEMGQIALTIFCKYAMEGV